MVVSVSFSANIALPNTACKSLQTLQRFAGAVLEAYLCINKNKTVMGRYISTGIVFQYRFSKTEIERQFERRFWKRKPFSEMKQAIISQLFPEIYDYEEDENYLFIYLSDSLKGDDVIATIKAYYALVGINERESHEIDKISEMLKGKTMDEAYHLAQDKPSYLYQESDLGFSYAYYAYPLVIDGNKSFYPVHASVVMIDSSSAKTNTEDDLVSYDFFTDLLRYRMQPDKLADAMIIFLSP